MDGYFLYFRHFSQIHYPADELSSKLPALGENCICLVFFGAVARCAPKLHLPHDRLLTEHPLHAAHLDALPAPCTISKTDRPVVAARPSSLPCLQSLGRSNLHSRVSLLDRLIPGCGSPIDCAISMGRCSGCSCRCSGILGCIVGADVCHLLVDALFVLCLDVARAVCCSRTNSRFPADHSDNISQQKHISATVPTDSG